MDAPRFKDHRARLIYCPRMDAGNRPFNSQSPGIRKLCAFSVLVVLSLLFLINGWSEHKPGSWVRLRTVVKQPGLKVEVVMTQKLLEISLNKVVLETQTEYRLTGGASHESNRRREILKNEDRDSITIRREGDEEIAVGGEKLKCHWIQGAQAEDLSTEMKIWLSKDVPGGVARSEEVRAGHDPDIKTEVVAWEKK